MADPALLHILLLDDDEFVGEIIRRALRKAGLAVELKRVEGPGDLVRALDTFEPDLVLSDCCLPAYDGKSALRLVREFHPDVPVIMISGVMHDVQAAAFEAAGAAACVEKGRMADLAAAVKRVLATK